MHRSGIDPARIAEYEAERKQIMQAYTPRLKAVSGGSPEYGRLWNERADKLAALNTKYAMPAGVQEAAR